MTGDAETRMEVGPPPIWIVATNGNVPMAVPIKLATRMIPPCGQAAPALARNGAMPSRSAAIGRRTLLATTA
jgi:hypothetical protein